MIVAALLTVELLRFPHLPPCSPRSEPMLCALTQSAGAADVGVVHTTAYQGQSDWLLFWGPGHPSRVEPMRAQLAKGGHVIALDLAYWARDRKVRVSIDHAHPQRYVMQRDWPSTRLAADRIGTGAAWHPQGPIIIAGVGPKALVQYGRAVAEWEAAMITACRPFGRPLHYRPKKHSCPNPTTLLRRDDASIDAVLNGASLLVTWHSNTAVDAIRLGVPAICRDGAAAAVCPSTLGETLPRPLDPAVRDRFLANLAWFQWAPEEASSCWRWLREVLA